MAHVRSQIRAAAKAALAGGTVPASRIFRNRAKPITDDDLPAWRIFTPQELSQPLEIGSPRPMERVVRLTMEAAARGAGCEDALDALAVEAETRMAADLTLGGLAHVLHLAATEIEVSGEGRSAIGRLQLTFDVTTTTTDQDPETVL
ncbi:MAG: hypothetical protein JJ902_23345 [Roseibium sp.]|nr:hypothetical protein [Roseibium sp.]